ncbi:MAG: four helix bundle protein [Bacteroidia bacterium]
MGSFKSFEEIIAWQKARENTLLIYTITNQNGFEKDFGLKNQIRRSAVSVMANIAEGFDRNTDKEFAQFLFIAKGSNAETLSHLYVAFDLKYITEQEFEPLKEKIIEVRKVINGLISYLK